jgi:hypothetical protein
VRVPLYVLLALDCLQVVISLAAFARARRSAGAGAPSHARYSFTHGLLLLGGAALLAVPVILGLAHAISGTAAVIAALVLEAAAVLASRRVVERLDAAHQARRPGAAH